MVFHPIRSMSYKRLATDSSGGDSPIGISKVTVKIPELTISSTALTSPSKTTPSYKFIRLYGNPESHSFVHSTNPHELPQNRQDAIVDILESDAEDPFTLEPLSRLIAMHRDRKKDFIIARVTTEDPTYPDKFYYSYYAGHHINKVIFRTQPSEGLLHRMKARNPLNNMTIVGDVHYYIVQYKTGKQDSMNSSPVKRDLHAFNEDYQPKSAPILDYINSKLGRKKTLHLVFKINSGHETRAIRRWNKNAKSR